MKGGSAGGGVAEDTDPENVSSTALDALEGSLLGMALGDALGKLVEGHNEASSRAYVSERLAPALRRAACGPGGPGDPGNTVELLKW